jgi:hypothetical protein
VNFPVRRRPFFVTVFVTLTALAASCTLAFPADGLVRESSGVSTDLDAGCTPAACMNTACGFIPNTCDSSKTIQCGNQCAYRRVDGGAYDGSVVDATTTTCSESNLCQRVSKCVPKANPCVFMGVSFACHLRDDGCGGVVDCGNPCRGQERCAPVASGQFFCLCQPTPLAELCTTATCGKNLNDGCGKIVACPRCL